MANRTTVYAYVVGDLWHVGHKRFLRQAKALGDHLIVGVLTNEATMAYKREPVIPFCERMELVADSRQADEVVQQDDVDPTDNLKMRPDVDIVVHAHYPDTVLAHWEAACRYMARVGKQAIRLDYYPGQSTTDIIRSIKERLADGSL